MNTSVEAESNFIEIQLQLAIHCELQFIAAQKISIVPGVLLLILDLLSSLVLSMKSSYNG